MLFTQKLWMWLVVLAVTVASAVGGIILTVGLLVAGRSKAFNSQIEPPRK